MKFHTFTTDEMLEVYRRHPLRKETLLARVGRKDRISEHELAYDAVTAVTDQNHIGAAAFVLKLAERAKVTRADVVLDLGCGIGGPARLLAETFGCRVHGIDANANRVADALDLSRITALEQLTSFETRDFMAGSFDMQYTVVWGQNSWIHVSEREELARRAVSALKPGGCIAFDDVCLRRELEGPTEHQMYEEISHAWRSTIVSAHAWTRAFVRAGASIDVVEEDSEPYVRHYVKLTELARAHPTDYPLHEIRGWECARALGERQAFGFYRIVARAPSG